MAISAKQKKTAVALAKDVLKRLKRRYYRVKAQNGYVVYGKTKAWKNGEVMPGDDLQKLLPKIKQCEVCALGALFLSWVALHDKVKIPDNYLADHGILNPALIKNLLAKQIGSDQIRGAIYSVYEAPLEVYKAPLEREFEYGTGKPRRRLAKLMRNIIRNKGVYTPED